MKLSDDQRKRRTLLKGRARGLNSRIQRDLKELQQVELELKLVSSLKARVLNVLEHASVPLSPLSVHMRTTEADELKSVQACLSNLFQRGLVDRVGPGLYIANEEQS